MRLDMSGLGITTLDRRAELSSQRDWVAKSNRYEKGLVDKAYRDSNDPWKIKTYAPSIKKNQEEYQNVGTNEAEKQKLQTFIKPNQNRISILQDPVYLGEAKERKSLTVDELGEISMLERHSNFSD